jgi:hypothetical protein
MAGKDLSVVLANQASGIIVQANDLCISDDTSMKMAVEFLSTANKILDAAKAEKERVTKPIKEALKAEESRWVKLETSLKSAVAVLRQKMTEYQKKLEEKKKIEEERLTARVARGTMKPETAMAKIESLPEVGIVTTDSGAVQWMTIYKLVIDDVQAIPREYLKVDEVAVRAALKAGKVVPGARLVEEKVPKNIR